VTPVQQGLALEVARCFLLELAHLQRDGGADHPVPLDSVSSTSGMAALPRLADQFTGWQRSDQRAQSGLYGA
jgi:hypothetical protein